MVCLLRLHRIRPLVAALVAGAILWLLAGCAQSSRGRLSDPQTAESAESLIHRADASRTAGDLDGAERDIRQALALNPGLPDAFVAEGRVRLARLDLKGAIAQFNRALKARPNSASTWFFLADAEYQDGSPTKAFRHLNRAIALDSSMAEAYTARGHIRQMAGDIEGSLADYKRAEALAPKATTSDRDANTATGPHATPEALAATRQPAPAPPPAEKLSANLLTQHAIEHAKGGDNTHAIAELNEAIRQEPAHTGARLARARLLAQMGDLATAIADCREVIRNDPENGSAYMARGYVEGLMGALEDSQTDLTTAIRLNPKDPTAYLDRTTTRAKLHDLDGAIKDATMAASLDPTDSRAFLAMATLYSKQHVYARAAENFKEALRLKPDDNKTLNTFAWLLATCPDPNVRDGAAAVTYSRQACERTGWKEVRYLDTFSAASAAAGDFDAAIRWERKCIELESDARRQDEYRNRVAQYEHHRPIADDAR